MRTQLRAISPVIATVIILAVTIAIAIAVVGWITGLFGATTKGTPNLQLLADNYLYVNCTDNNGNVNYTVVVIHIKNVGTAAANIYKIEIQGIGAISNFNTTTSFTTDQLKGYITGNGKSTIQLKPGDEIYIIAYKQDNDMVAKLVPGTWYNVFIYTKESGAPISTTITAEACPASS